MRHGESPQLTYRQIRRPTSHPADEGARGQVRRDRDQNAICAQGETDGQGQEESWQAPRWAAHALLSVMYLSKRGCVRAFAYQRVRDVGGRARTRGRGRACSTCSYDTSSNFHETLASLNRLPAFLLLLSKPGQITYRKEPRTG